ncbi:penicillin-binding protein, partial [Patescibacteria group bacterium]|nr:penicillin-binding protein [Patescibacteria group bacterium]
FLFITLFAMAAAGSVVFAYLLRTLPDPVKISQRKTVESTKIFDRTGTVLLYEIHGEEKRTSISFEEIPQAVKQATIAVEDANFYQHPGIDVRGILRAFIVDLVSSSLSQGGSTITQQLIKNSFLGGERTMIRKIKEVVLAVRLESKYSKDQILNLYLNEIPYGSNAYGIEAAAETFFGKSASDLTLREISILASLPRAPSYYSPYGNHKNELFARADFILEKMFKSGFISEEAYHDAQKEKVSFVQPARGMLAPHFVIMVRDYLTQKYGEDAIENGGLKVITTLDWRMQQEAEKILKEGVEHNAKTIHATNGALVATDPKSGDVLALVGSKDYFDTQHEGNFNVATAPRQPGSAFKPFAYAAAFTKGFTPETVLFDVPTEFNPTCPPDGASETGNDGNPCYHPKNYDGKFRGPITLRQSIAQSINVTSVKLLYLAGIDEAIKLAQSLGITTINDRSRLGLSLVLGGAEVKLLDMVSAYGVFANDGVKNPATVILEVDQNNAVLEKKENKSAQVLDAQIARTINDVLSDNNARQPVFHPLSSLYFPGRSVAAKTGTTQDYRDAWTIGYTPSLSVGVWVGNNDNSPIQQSS